MLTGKSHETPIDVEVRDEGARRQTVLQAGTKVQEAEELQCNNKVEASTLEVLYAVQAS